MSGENQRQVGEGSDMSTKTNLPSSYSYCHTNEASIARRTILMEGEYSGSPRATGIM